MVRRPTKRQKVAWYMCLTLCSSFGIFHVVLVLSYVCLCCCYRKYRYDVHFYYKNVAPPPREMWQEGILDMHTPESQQWLLRRELAEMYDTSSDEDP